MTDGCWKPIFLPTAIAVSAALSVVARASLPIAHFQTETTIDRLSLERSVTDLDGEQDYQANMSGCCAVPSTGELLIVMNRSQNFSKPPAIQVYDRDGTYLRHITLTGFSDAEGLCQYDPAKGEFAIVDEVANDITIVTITPATTNIVKSAGHVIDTGIPVGADGLEGVTYDRQNGIFYAVQEVPMAVFRITTNGGSVVSEELFDADTVFDGICTDLSDLFYDSGSGHLLILSDEGKLLMECTLDGTILASLPVVGTQPEGITISDAGTELYICGEPNEYYRYAVAPLFGEAAEGTTVELLVELSAAPTGSVSVGYTISSDTAVPGEDFALPASGTLMFGPDSLCATVTVGVLRDTVAEDVEVLSVALTNAVGVELAGDSAYDLRIINGSADVPVLGDWPFDCEVTPDVTPSFSFQANDPDGAAGMVYEIRWSTDPGFVTGVIVRGSASDAGFENVSDGVDTSPFTEGQQVRFTVQPDDGLSDTLADTVYYWQVRACDAAADWGSGAFGEWSAARSLAVDSGLALPAWGQTAGEQFSRDSMDATEVSASDSVQLGQADIGFDKAASGRAATGPVTMSWSWEDTRDRDWALIAVPLRSAATTVGSVVSPPIDFDWVPGSDDWGELTFTDDESAGDIAYGIQSWDGAEWRDTSITNRGTSPVDIGGLDPVVHGRIRLKATLTRGTGSPQLLDWRVSWTPAPRCRITGAGLTQDGLRVQWSGVEGVRYAVYCSSNLLTSWPVQPFTNGLTGDPSGMNAVVLPTPGTPRAFYRIVEESL